MEAGSSSGWGRAAAGCSAGRGSSRSAGLGSDGMEEWAAGTSGQAQTVLQPVAPATEQGWLGVPLVPSCLLAPLPSQGDRTSPSHFFFQQRLSETLAWCCCPSVR